jgi:putative hemolysin
LQDKPMTTNARAAAVPFTLNRGRLLDALLGLRTLQHHYESLPSGDFVVEALRRLDIRAAVEGSARLPRDGGVIITANHPTGAMDGLLMLSAVRGIRPDVRVLGNRWLTRIPEMREWTIPLDLYAPLPTQRLAALREARRWVAAGGALIVFPAGAVARTFNGKMPVDEPWSEGVLALSRWTTAPIVPVHVAAQPSRWMRLAGRLHAWATTAMLPRELLHQAGARVPVHVGEPVPWSRLDDLPTPAARLAYLRARVAALAPSQVAATKAPPVAPEVLNSLVAREISALPRHCRLLEHGSFEVYCASANAIPLTLREIGRLRERTFRAVGEGTGRATDLDEFDQRYLHLFLWNRSRSEIVGAYRMASTRHGGPRLYTETLFTWSRGPRLQLGDALELGRSFVRAEYQRDPSTLLLLWKGIGAFISRHPHLRRLFGPVSVSAEFSGPTRYLIARWLATRAHAQGSVHGRHAIARYPEIDELISSGAAETLPALESMVRELEGSRGLPVLLRQYLRLNGRVLAVSRDPHFADTMDALIMVDMLDMPASHLERYCGRIGAERIRKYHEGSMRSTPHQQSPYETVTRGAPAMRQVSA